MNDHDGQALDANIYKEKRERSNALLQESQIMGMEGNIQVITNRILKENNSRVVAIVGMGG